MTSRSARRKLWLTILRHRRPQQGDTQMACIATLVWMRVKADHDLAALREGPAGHSSGAVGPIADVRSRRFPECLLVFPTDIDRRPDEMLQGPLFRVRTASTPIEPIHSLFCCSKFPVRAKAIPCSVAQGIFR